MADFIEDLVVRNLVEFSVHYVIWRCPHGQKKTIPCQSQCIFQGRYCSPQPDITPGSRVTGQDIIKVNTSQTLSQNLVFYAGNYKGIVFVQTCSRDWTGVHLVGIHCEIPSSVQSIDG